MLENVSGAFCGSELCEQGTVAVLLLWGSIQLTRVHDSKWEKRSRHQLRTAKQLGQVQCRVSMVIQTVAEEPG